MPQWQRYPKISESTQAFTPEAGDAASSNWVVTEKIHGANFSIAVSADGAITFASRGRQLAASDNFFGFRSQGLHVTLAECAQALRERLVAEGTMQDAAGIVVYGELFGGEYPHPDVPASVSSPGPIQRGCWYSPTLAYLAFDVAIALEAATEVAFINFDTAHVAATAAGLRFAAPLSRGSLAQCLGYNPRFTSTLPALLGLPALPGDPNLAEGIVVRSVHGPRRLVKIKIAEFSERQYQNEQWREVRAGKGGRGGKPGATTSWEDNEAMLRFEMLAAINAQRLAAVLSKTGTVDPANKAACRQLLDDVMADVEEALIDDGLLTQPGQLRSCHGELHQELERESRKVCAAHLRAQRP